MSDGIMKDWEVIQRQVRAYRNECKVIKQKVKDAPTVRRKLHHASGYLEEGIDLMPRVWTYTWAPKWALVLWLIFL